MKTASEIIDYLGRDDVAASLGIKPHAVAVRAAEGKLPAAWYHKLEQMAGRPLPRDCFSFKGVS
jgi:hypothetical protein